jgi:hypothetical protein
MLFSYLESDRVKQLIEIVHGNRIQPRFLLTWCNAGFMASLPFTGQANVDLLTDMHELNGTERLRDDSVPLICWLALLICTLDTKLSPDVDVVVEIALEVFEKSPIASRQVHEATGDLLFFMEANKGKARPSGSSVPAVTHPEASPRSSGPDSICKSRLSPSSGLTAVCSSVPEPSARPKSDNTDAPPVADRETEPTTVRSPVCAHVQAPTSVPPPSGQVPVHAPTIFTLATAGAAGGGATMLQMVFLPVGHTAVATEQHCFLTVIAAIPVGALGAVYLWSVAEEIARTRARPHGRLFRYLLISLGALIGGGAISLLAHALADLAFNNGPSPEWLPLGISGAMGALCAAWSRAMARPTTVWRALWTAAVATGGTFAGYMAYVPIVGLLGGLGYNPAPLLALTRLSTMVAAGAFVFVAVTQIMMSLQLHGVDALALRSSSIPVKPESDLVPRPVLPITVLGAIAVALVVLGHSCSFALRAGIP